MPRKATAITTHASHVRAASPSPAPLSPTPDGQPEGLPLPAVALGEVVRLKGTKLLYKVIAVYSTNAIAHAHDASLAEEWATLMRQDDGQAAKWKVIQLEKVEG